MNMVVMAKVLIVIGNGFRILIAGSLLAILAGCNSTDTGGALDVSTTPPPPVTPATPNAAVAAGAPAQAPMGAMVQGNCPRVVLRDGTAFYRNYAKGAKVLPNGSKDPDKLMYQVSLAETTRQCSQTNGQIFATVLAQGRVIVGPAGASPTISMPIRVALVDGNATTYTDLQPFQISLTPGQTTGQFVYTKTAIPLPANTSDMAQIFIGFDEGPVKPEKKKKN